MGRYGAFDRLSVVIPAYNAEDTLERAIQSVQAQSIVPDEIVIGNDASTDGTSALGTRLGAKVLDLPKGNGSIARNRAAEAATGDLLFFLDADDAWTPNKVEKHLEAWKSHSASFILDRATLVRPNGSVAEVKGPSGEVVWREFILLKNWTCGSSFSIPRSSYWEVGGFNESLRGMQDVDFWVRAAHRLGPAWGLDEALTLYHLSAGASVSKTPSQVLANLSELLDGWKGIEDSAKRAFVQEIALVSARRTPLPGSLKFFSMAKWPIHRGLFWRCVAATFKRTFERSQKPVQAMPSSS